VLSADLSHTSVGAMQENLFSVEHSSLECRLYVKKIETLMKNQMSNFAMKENSIAQENSCSVAHFT
jgi:hypothetical protein